MDLYKEIVDLHKLSIPCDALRVAINDEFGSMDQHLKDGDVITFISPVAGG